MCVCVCALGVRGFLFVLQCLSSDTAFVARRHGPCVKLMFESVTERIMGGMPQSRPRALEHLALTAHERDRHACL